MATTYNNETLNTLREEAGIQQNVEAVPMKLIDNIQPVIVANPKMRLNVLSYVARSTTGAATVYTVPASSKKFFLTSIYFSFLCDVACDSQYYLLSVVPKGQATTNIIYFPKATTTVVNQQIAYTLPFPMELEPGSAVSATHAFTAGTSTIVTSITGILKDRGQ